MPIYNSNDFESTKCSKTQGFSLERAEHQSTPYDTVKSESDILTFDINNPLQEIDV